MEKPENFHRGVEILLRKIFERGFIHVMAYSGNKFHYISIG